MEAEKKRIRLKTTTPLQTRKTITRIMNLTINGEIDSKTANTLIYGCNSILLSIRTDEQQKKLDQLEGVLNALK